jgi:hypothetical protein
MAIRGVRLRDPWAQRNLIICVRRVAELPDHGQRLVRHLSAERTKP